MLLKISASSQMLQYIKHISRRRSFLLKHFIHGILHQFGIYHIQKCSRQRKHHAQRKEALTSFKKVCEHRKPCKFNPR